MTINSPDVVIATAKTDILQAPKIVDIQEKSQINIWGGVTNPVHHNPDSFRYLTHAFNAHNEQINLGVALTGEEYSPTQAVDLLEEPEKVAERISLSMSLIDQNHTDVWGKSGGIIVKSPEKNIVVTSPKDAATDNSNRSALEILAGQSTLLSADEVLAQTKDGTYNEIVALGKTPEGNDLQLDGFFTITDADGDVSDTVMAERLKGLATKSNFPFVEIVYSGFRNEGKYTKGAGKLTRTVVHSDGKEYCIDDGVGRSFEVNTGIKSYFASEKEMQEMVHNLTNKAILTTGEGEKIMKRYADAFKQKMRPIIANEGSTNYISFQLGSGPHYSEYHYRGDKIFRVVHKGGAKVTENIAAEEFKKGLEEDKENLTSEEYQTILSRLPKN